jgi:hypothetical protein
MMKRRTFLAGGLMLPALLGTARATEKQWSNRLLLGGFDGAIHHAGLAIKLAPGWKTYWRNPGDGGIPPLIEGRAENLESLEFDCPLPQRFSDPSGETIGYKDEVVFPIRMTPVDVSKPINGTLTAFLGICDVVCIPVPLDMPLTSQAALASGPDMTELQRWQMKVPPRKINGPVIRVQSNGSDLLAELQEPVSDLIVEFREGPGFFVGSPVMDGMTAVLKTSAKSNEQLRDRRVSLTSVVNGKGVEQDMFVV